MTDPRGSRLEQWRDVAVNKGLAQLEYQLTDEPALGTWKIHVRHTANRTEAVAKFTVSENVLSKFEVVAAESNTKFVLRTDDIATFRFCGRYTHGGAVDRGSLHATFTSIYRPIQWGSLPKKITVVKPVVTLQDGCAEINLGVDDIAKLTNKTTTFLVTAIIEEEGTQIQQRATSKIRASLSY